MQLAQFDVGNPGLCRRLAQFGDCSYLRSMPRSELGTASPLSPPQGASPTHRHVDETAVAQLTKAEACARCVLRIPAGKPTATEDEAHRMFSASIAVSAIRCLVTYVLLPIIAPLTGSALGESAWIGIPLSVVALVFDVVAVRRFWLAYHPWRWKMTAVYGIVMALITGLMVHDIVHLIG